MEIRGDLTPDVAAFESPLPLLVSPRGTGMQLIKELKPAFVDLVLEEKLEVPSGISVIRSFHNHEKTPAIAELKKIAASLMELKPDIIKIATMIRSYDDLKTLDALHKEIPLSQKRVILGMGPKAHLNRMLSPLRNELTYTFIDAGEESAPGQAPLSLHLLTTHCKKPKIFGILGGPQVTESFSPIIHNTLFHQHGIDALYAAFPAKDLKETFTALEALGVEGLSVTAPFKETIIPLLNGLDDEARRIGSVNTVIKKADRFIGSNTDVAGLRHGYDWSTVRSVAILGSGGVVPAVIACCQAEGIKDITVYGRNATRREELATRFGVKHAAPDALRSAKPDRVVCAISENIDVDLPPAAPGATALDLRYAASRFLINAAKAGYATLDGLPMLLHQALEQFRIFSGITAVPEKLDCVLPMHS